MGELTKKILNDNINKRVVIYRNDIRFVHKCIVLAVSDSDVKIYDIVKKVEKVISLNIIKEVTVGGNQNE